MTHGKLRNILRDAESLPAREKLDLIKHLVPGLESSLRTSHRSLREILLDEIRRDVLKSLPRREFWCPARTDLQAEV